MCCPYLPHAIVVIPFMIPGKHVSAFSLILVCSFGVFSGSDALMRSFGVNFFIICYDNG